VGKVQLAVPSPHPVKAGEKLTFQVILINTGTEKWTAKEYSLRAEIYDAEKNYLTRTDSIKGRVEVEAGGTVSLYIPFRVPGNYSGTYSLLSEKAPCFSRGDELLPFVFFVFFSWRIC